MKLLRSLPKDRGFFDVYALLIKVIRKSKTAAQIVSGLTEIGIIYTITYQSVHPILPYSAIYISSVVAVIFTMVIEGGLRVLMPLSVDSILFKRFSGLHLPMTIFILWVTILLLATSGLLSFQNSNEIVAAVTPKATEKTTTAIDSSYQSELADLKASFSRDSFMTAKRYKDQLEAQKQAFKGKINATKRKLQTYINREARTGNSYASSKDWQKEKIANLEAEQGHAIAVLLSAQNKELIQLGNEFKEGVKAIAIERKTASAKLKADNVQAETERSEKVNSYGGKLGYFTLICLFLFITANILDRIHAKGSGIEETVDMNQYDISPKWTTNLREAIRDRFNYFLQSRIKRFADKTPPAPLPVNKAELYDPTQAANVTIKLQIQHNGQPEDNVIVIEPKRRQIGFQQFTETTNRSKPIPNVHAHEKKCAIKDSPTHKVTDTYDHKDLRQLKQRLKMYKKRLGSHQQKKIKAERKGEVISKKTLNAIENNQNWVTHYELLINELETRST